MLNIIEEKLADVRKTAQEQSNRIASEVNSGADALNAALTRFNTTMQQVKLKREEADQLQAAAVRELDTALSQHQSVQLGIVQQLADGRMVTGSDAAVVPSRKPKLKAVEGGEA